ncbi:alpha/beta fold hydrolase [Massilia sp. Se16.2.3]|uniref:alpha/beta fold hydrolase n=1 Tax=Massilia sp. Se16.2.3 TaxID=2709303 RepID=UPI0015FECBE4|nr:alpha/beta fold hydrolase [Massilia sp. Se16.2.3]QNA97803.1 alpha/beta fold hydrolase [Massilia sp. Se16.2.3]
MRPLMVPVKQRLQFAGVTVEYIVAGKGAPGIVLVAGAGGPVESWYKVFGELAEAHTVFAYNRAGIGESSKPDAPQTAAAMVRTLRAFLLAAGVPRPWVLVGHSLGGLVVNLFARSHPDEVGAVVLVEATAPEDVRILPRHDHALQRWLKRLVTRLSPPHPLGPRPSSSTPAWPSSMPRRLFRRYLCMSSAARVPRWPGPRRGRSCAHGKPINANW